MTDYTLYEERAAILEFDAGMTRGEAERLAALESIEQTELAFT